MQENRSFDMYFGIYPGADGIPMKRGVPAVCVPDPLTRKCVAPFADHKDQNPGAPHEASDSVTDVNGGEMDGVIKDAEAGRGPGRPQRTPPPGTGAPTPGRNPHHSAQPKNN